MHVNTQYKDQLLFQHPSVGFDSYGHHALSYKEPNSLK